MKLYYDPSHYDKNYRGHVFPLLKPFLKPANFSDSNRMVVYNISEKDIIFSPTLEESDLVILTMSWNFYYLTDQLTSAYTIIERAQASNKKVYSIVTGDFGVKTPKFSNLIIFRSSGYRSKLNDSHQGIPVFIEDPLKKHFKSRAIITRPFKAVPTIGFCGQANPALPNALNEVMKVFYRNIKYWFRLSKSCPQTIQSTSFLRAQFLRRLEKSSQVSTNFIYRKKYKAGATNERHKEIIIQEFFQNMLNSDYVLCYRGAGNFSTRFYETLAIGRVPILVNTDCLLPLNDSINWRKHVVWVESRETHLIADKVVEFHNQHDEYSFQSLMKSNRLLWESKLQLGGFFRCVLERFKN